MAQTEDKKSINLDPHNTGCFALKKENEEIYQDNMGSQSDLEHLVGNELKGCGDSAARKLTRNRDGNSSRIHKMVKKEEDIFKNSQLVKQENLEPGAISKFDGRSAIGKKIRETIILEACDRMKQGVSSWQIATDYDVCIETARNWRKKYLPHLGPEIRRKPGFYSRETMDKACNQLKQGVSIRDVSREFQIKTSTIERWHTKYVTERAPELMMEIGKYTYTSDLIKTICKDLIEGNSVNDVAKKFGFDYRTIQGWKSKFIKNGKILMENKQEKLTKAKTWWDQEGLNSRHEVMVEACNRLRRGESLHSVVTQLDAWEKKMDERRKRHGLPKLKPNQKNYNSKIVLRACNRLMQGQTVRDVAKDVGVLYTTVKYWQRSLFREDEFKSTTATVQDESKTSLTASRHELLKTLTNSKLIADSKLMLDPRVVMTRDSRIDNLAFNKRSHTGDLNNNCHGSFYTSGIQKKLTKKTFLPLRKVHIPRLLKLQVIQMVIDEGVPVVEISRKLNVNASIIESWIFNKELLRKNFDETKLDVSFITE